MQNIENLLKYLPGILKTDADEESGEKSFVERFLMIFQEEFAVIETKVDKIPNLFDPWRADDELLDYLASWLALELPKEWGEATKRALIDSITDIYSKRGTLKGLELILSIYLGAAVKQIIEDINHPYIFKVLIYFPKFAPEELVQRIRAIRQIINREKPAHTDYQWDILTPTMQIGVHSTIGEDTILGTSPNIEL